jgi:hypothetical protein
MNIKLADTAKIYMPKYSLEFSHVTPFTSYTGTIGTSSDCPSKDSFAERCRNISCAFQQTIKIFFAMFSCNRRWNNCIVEKGEHLRVDATNPTLLPG